MAAPQKHKMADDGYFYKDDDVSVQNQDVRFSLLGGLGVSTYYGTCRESITWLIAI